LLPDFRRLRANDRPSAPRSPDRDQASDDARAFLLPQLIRRLDRYDCYCHGLPAARSINFLRAPRIELTKIDPHRSSRQPL
jgi:hypothetical protein